MYEGALAGAGCAEDGDELAGIDLEADVMDDGGVSLLVAHGDAVELDVPAGAVEGACVRALFDRGLGVDNVEDALTGGVSAGEHVDHEAHHAHGHGHEADVEDEGGEVTGGEAVGGDLSSAEPEDGAGRGGEDECHQGAVEGELLGCVVGEVADGVGTLGELPLGVPSRAEDLDDLDAGDVFLEDGGHLAGLCLHSAPRVSQLAGHSKCAPEDGGHEEHDDYGEPPVDVEHDDGHEEEGGDHRESADEGGAHETLDGLDVGGGLGHEVAGLLLVVEAEAEVLEPGEDVVADVIGGLLGDGLGEVVLQIAEDTSQCAREENRTGGDVE